MSIGLGVILEDSGNRNTGEQVMASQAYAIRRWLENNWKRIQEGNVTKDKAVGLIREEIGAETTEAALTSFAVAMRSEGYIKGNWPHRTKSKANGGTAMGTVKQLRYAVGIIAKELVRLNGELGQTVLPELKILSEIVSQDENQSKKEDRSDAVLRSEDNEC